MVGKNNFTTSGLSSLTNLCNANPIIKTRIHSGDVDTKRVKFPPLTVQRENPAESLESCKSLSFKLSPGGGSKAAHLFDLG